MQLTNSRAPWVSGNWIGKKNVLIPRVWKCRQYKELHAQPRSCIRGVTALFMGTRVTLKEVSELTNVVLAQDPWLQGFLAINIDLSLVHETQLISPRKKRSDFNPFYCRCRWLILVNQFALISSRLECPRYWNKSKPRCSTPAWAWFTHHGTALSLWEDGPRKRFCGTGHRCCLTITGNTWQLRELEINCHGLTLADN